MLAPMGGGTASAAKVRVVYDSLSTFKSNVDKILTALEESPAARKRVADQRITRNAVSGANAPFHEADALYENFHRVHHELTQLSTMLSDQIESLGIVVQGASQGFQNLEESQRQRFWEIQSRLEQHAADQQNKGETDVTESGYTPE